MYTRLPAILLAVAALSACDSTTGATGDTQDAESTDTSGTLEPIVLGTQTDSGMTVELLADGPLVVGWNQVYFRLTDEASGDVITDATVSQAPLMTMTDKKHACPFTDPAGADTDDLFAGELVPIMASGMMGTWSNTITVHDNAAGTDHTVVFDLLDVAETDMKKNLLVTNGADEITYIVALTPTDDVSVGDNDFVLTVHRKASMMSFPAVDDLTIVVEPLMPDMGHGSVGNVDPVYDANGRYHGTMALVMTGYWTVDFHVSQGGTDLGTVQYTFNL